MISCNAQTVVNEARADLKPIAGATVIKIPTPTGPAGNVKIGTRLESGMMISAKARDSPSAPTDLSTIAALLRGHL